MYSWVNTLLEEAALSRKKQKTKNNLTQVVFLQEAHSPRCHNVRVPKL